MTSTNVSHVFSAWTATSRLARAACLGLALVGAGAMSGMTRQASPDLGLPAPGSIGTGTIRVDGKDVQVRVSVYRSMTGYTDDGEPQWSPLNMSVDIGSATVGLAVKVKNPKVTVQMVNRKWSPTLVMAPVLAYDPGTNAYYAGYGGKQNWPVGSRLTGKFEARVGKKNVTVQLRSLRVMGVGPTL